MTTALSLARYFIIALGTVYILTESVIGLPWRILATRTGSFMRVLAYCRACTGFWVGVALTNLSPFEDRWRIATSGMLIMLLGYAWSLFAENTAWRTETVRVVRVVEHDTADPESEDE